MRERFWRWLADRIYPLILDRLIEREREKRRQGLRLVSLAERIKQQKGME
jgi:hypothetical protein